MKINYNNNTLTLYLTGRVNSENAPSLEAEISSELAKFPGSVPAFDASELEYISSTGLRILLKFRKQFGKNLDVLNVSNDVYTIFDLTGLNQLLNVKRRLREVSVEGCEVIGGGYFSTVYKLNEDTIIKVFDRAPITLETIESDQKRAREIFIRDIPTVIPFDVVRVGEHYAIVYERSDAISLSAAITQNPERLPELGRKAGALLKKLHTTEFAPGTLPDARDGQYKQFKLLHEHGLISDAELGMLNGIVDGIPHRNTLIHYGYHQKNILVRGDELVLIDVGEASLGNPIFDWAALYLVEFLLEKTMNAPAELMNSPQNINASPMFGLWREMMTGYFGTSDAEKLRNYSEIIEGYAMLRSVFMTSHYIDTEIFGADIDLKPVLRMSLQYLAKYGVKSLEGVF